MPGAPITGSVGGGSGGPPGSSITYQPGGTAAPGVYTSWATAVAAAQDLDGIVTINVDASLGTPTFSGTVNLQRRMRVVAFGPSLPVSATVSSGAVMQNASYFEGITFAGTLSASVFTTTDSAPHDLTFANCARAETADAADLIELATGTNKVSFLGSSAFTSASRAAVTLASGENVSLRVDGTASLGAAVVAGSAGTLTANVAAAASLSTSGFSGTLSRTNADTEAARTTAVDEAAGWHGPDQGFGTDGAVTYNAGGAATALTAPLNASSLTINPSGGGTPTTLDMGGHPVAVTGTLSLGAGCILHHNGGSVAANTQAGASGVSGGTLGNTQQAGANGGGVNSSGGNATTQSNALGGKGGSGGKGSQPGGTSPAATFPVLGSGGVGRWISSVFAFFLSGSWTRPAGGGGGSSGGGDADSFGSGGGSGGGVGQVHAKRIELAAGAKISCGGGAGGSNSNGAGGGGGGGGGYLEVHCDELEMDGDYPDHFTCAGGVGGAATGGGVSGSDGAAGRVRVWKRGQLVYST
jgi:hypothetical protein